MRDTQTRTALKTKKIMGGTEREREVESTLSTSLSLSLSGGSTDTHIRTAKKTKKLGGYTESQQCDLIHSQMDRQQADHISLSLFFSKYGK
jgi:hypothetical protein